MESTDNRAGHPRASPRYKLFQPTEMMVSGAAARVHLLNVSRGGALIYAAAPPAKGTTLRVRCGGAFRSARVAWADERRFGVTFTLPLIDAQVATLIDDQRARIDAATSRMAAAAGR